MMTVRRRAKKSVAQAASARGSVRAQPAWILILSLTAVCLAMIGVVRWYYRIQKEATEAAAVRVLYGVAATKASQLANWRSERIGDGHVVMASPLMRIARRILSDRAPSDADRKELLDVMHRLAKSFLYTDVTLVDLDGSVRLRLDKERTESAAFQQHSRRALALEANQARDVVLSDLTLDTRTGKPLMSVTAPVEGLGAIVLDIDPARFLYPYLEAWPGDSRTAESILGRRDGDYVVYLSPRRHAPEAPPLSRRRPQIHLPPDAVMDAGFPLRMPDYRGVPVLGTIRHVPDSPWYLLCKIDAAEVDAAVHRLGWEMSLIAALIGLSNAAGAVLIWRDQQARMHRDREAWLHTAVNDTPALLWMSNVGGENSLVNKPLRTFLGVKGETLPKPWTDYLHPDDVDRVRTGLRQALAEARRYTAEFRIRRWDGEYRVVISEGAPRFSPSGELAGYAGSVVDITDRRRAEDQTRALSARLITAQEDERTRLARELHDDLNQQIAAVSIGMGNLKRQIPEGQTEPRSQIDRIHQRLVQLAESVRRMSHQLHPAVLEYQGLAPALRSCCEEFTSLTGIRVSFRGDGCFEGVPSSTALCLYRITQEALQNIAKHASAASAEVGLDRSENLLRLAVSDSGVGMDADEAKSNPGLGLISIQERARLAGGMVAIESEPNHGTRLTVEIPI